MLRRTSAILLFVILSGCYDTMTARRQRRTCQDLAAVAKQLRTYRQSHGVFPRSDDVRQLQRALDLRLLLNDAWSNPLRYRATADGQHYTLASAGADGRFDAEAPVSHRIELTNDSARDIVVRDGIFVQFPRAAQRVISAAPN